MNIYIVKALFRVGLIKKIKTSVPVSLNGKPVRIPVINGMGYDNLRISEIWMCELLKKILPLKQGIFIDVGVNVGQTLIKLRSVDSTKEYLGFEPNPRCVYYSDALVKENNFTNCRIIPAGLLDRNTILELNMYSAEDTDCLASVIPEFRPDSHIYNKIYVPVYQFDEISRQLGIKEIAIIKIDVEGAELEVLQSLQNVITSNRPILMMEILPCYDVNNAERVNRQQQLEALLKGAGYRMIRIIKNADGRTIDQYLELDTIGIHSNTDWCEYVLIPKEIAADTLTITKA